MRIEQLYLFPVKSLAGIQMQELTLTETGPAFDRAWMVVDEDGKFLTQRELPRMALVRPSLGKEALTLTAAETGESRSVPLTAVEGERPVRVWSDSLPALDCGEDAASFLTRFLGRSARLVRLLDPRTKVGEHARSLSFVDDYPLHVVPLSSLRDLNARLPAGSPPLEVLRFRPNIVVSGTEAWEEDRWKSLRFGAHELRAGRACTRCAITTVDPATAARGPEPLKTLAGFRRNAQNKLEFGLYLHSAPGAVLRVGQELEAVYKRGQGPA